MTTDPDVVEFTGDDGTHYKVTGLASQAYAVGIVAGAIDSAISQRATAARGALAAWEGRHAATFAERVDAVLLTMVALRQALAAFGRELTTFPDFADPDDVGPPPTGSGVEVPAV